MKNIGCAAINGFLALLFVLAPCNANLPLPTVASIVDGIGFTDDGGLVQRNCIAGKCVVTRFVDENLSVKFTFPEYLTLAILRVQAV